MCLVIKVLVGMVKLACLYIMTMGMQQHPGAPKPTLDRKESVFSNIESVYEHLHSHGVGTDTGHPPVTLPKTLQCTVSSMIVSMRLPC